MVCGALALESCLPVPPPAPTSHVPKDPYDSYARGVSADGSEVSFDSASGPVGVEVAFGVTPVRLCAATPCVTRLSRGGYDVRITKGDARGTVTIQVTREPTIVTVACNEGRGSLACSVSAVHPEDGRTFEGATR